MMKSLLVALRGGMRYVTLVVASAIFANAALAHDARCDSAPYSMTGAHYANLITFMHGVGITDDPLRLIRQVCEAKYGGGDRTPLYNLGITDQHINNTATDMLVVDVITNLRHAVRNEPLEAKD